MANLWSILPPDCWELILKRVDDLEVLSLVCKDFLSISNNLLHHLALFSFSNEILNRLLKRFRCLKEIDLSDFHGDMNLAVLEIARSGLNIESLNVSWHDKLSVESFAELGSYMKSLKTLECFSISHLKDSDLIVIATSLPWLEEIDISWGSDITDDGIEMLAKSLGNLKKIDISGNDCLTGQSLVYLFSNCPFLRKIKVCKYESEDCIAQLFRHCPDLVSLCMNRYMWMNSSPSMFSIENSIAYAKNLRVLKFSGEFISDSILSAITKARLPLKKLELSRCCISKEGLAMLLHACSSLKELDLHNSRLNDRDMDGLFGYLKNITHINLGSLEGITSSTFFNLIRNCPLLVEIDMTDTSLGYAYEDLFSMDLSKHYHIQNLILSENLYLMDDLLIKIGLSCPNLQVLDVECCRHITNVGIGEILKTCNKINVLSCNGPKIFGTDLDLSELNLEGLKVSNIDDEELALIAKRCPQLWKLDLSTRYNKEVTNKGVMAVVENCRKLSEIHLRGCSNVTVDILPLMVSSGPSLRRIEPPCTYVPSEDHEDLFLLHKGYLICNRDGITS